MAVKGLLLFNVYIIFLDVYYYMLMPVLSYN